MLKARQRLGKYRIDGRIAASSLATVYRAVDTIEGVRVALKLPHPHLSDEHFLSDLRTEVRLAAKLHHDKVLPVKDASFIDGKFVIVTPLGEKALSDRLRSRLSLTTVMDYAEQMLEAVAYAHSKRIIHCDIKPENFILFPGNQLRLADFGLARIALRTVKAAGSGTVGYIAPEQAMGRPSFRSDVFSLGLILYRMLTGALPEWPFVWPPPCHDKLRKRVPTELSVLIQRAIDPLPARRFRDAGAMLASFRKLKAPVLRHNSPTYRPQSVPKRDWRQVRRRQFTRLFGQALQTDLACVRCGEPVSESMIACPWCGAGRKRLPERTRFPARCARCRRGRKLDWKYCAWCFGKGFEEVSSKEYTDKRYQARCANPRCSRKLLMSHMRYCPWCRSKVRRKWRIPGSRDSCPACEQGVTLDFWDYCPWCSTELLAYRKRA